MSDSEFKTVKFLTLCDDYDAKFKVHSKIQLLDDNDNLIGSPSSFTLKGIQKPTQGCVYSIEAKVNDEAKLRRKNGEDVHIDHIVPICSDIVSGLHVPWNLEVIDAVANMKKSNNWWPDMPFQQLTLF